MCAAAVVYANYKSAIDVFEGGPDIRTVGLNTSTAGIFCTYPTAFMTKTGQFFSEFIASTILMFCIYALKDDGNLRAGNLTPLMLFFLIFGYWSLLWLGDWICDELGTRLWSSFDVILPWVRP
jgi:aquaglyceroporin related protein